MGWNNPGWTEERTSILRDLWRDGFSASQIARELGGVTRNAVIGKVHRLGLCGRATKRKRSAITYDPLARRNRVLAAALRASEPRLVGVEAPERPPEQSPPLNTPLSDLSWGMCRAVVDGAGADALFCGHATAEGSSWCAYHRSRYVSTRSAHLPNTDELVAELRRVRWAVGR